MSLHGVRLAADSPLNAKFRPHLGTCLMQGKGLTFDISAALRNSLLSALIRDSALALSLHSHAERGGRHVAETDSAANQFGRPRAENRAAHFRLLWPLFCPSHICRISG